MKFSKIILASVFAASFAVLAGCSETEADYKAKFTAECQKGTAGISADISAKLCDCVFVKLKDKYDVSKILELDKARDAEFLTFTAQSAQMCMADILKAN